MDRNVGSCTAEVDHYAVALRKESVDRNTSFLPASLSGLVALRKESVDRNRLLASGSCLVAVALRKESVDRNFNAVQVVIVIMQSLSARRAWIEMMLDA